MQPPPPPLALQTALSTRSNAYSKACNRASPVFRRRVVWRGAAQLQAGGMLEQGVVWVGPVVL